MDDPYSPPRASVESLPAFDREQEVRLEKIRTGQRFVIWAILLYFLLGALSATASSANTVLAAIVGLAMIPLLLAIVVMSFLGLFRMWSGFGTHVAYRIIMAVLLFVPLIGLLVLASSSARATKRLREHGYRVGLLGAGPRS